ncbi:hypothetical protein Mapa_004450 [Marchantia paleacea]|nr:hypothetical protein Mapa_004450 [Marchantia paleacea]
MEITLLHFIGFFQAATARRQVLNVWQGTHPECCKTGLSLLELQFTEKQFSTSSRAALRMCRCSQSILASQLFQPELRVVPQLQSIEEDYQRVGPGFRRWICKSSQRLIV